MKKALFVGLVLVFFSCGESSQNIEPRKESNKKNREKSLLEMPPFSEDGRVNALIEIPAGTIEKWELNKSTGSPSLEQVDGQPRLIQYLGYPGNYGMIPGTLLPKDKGGDGDPLDILVLGPKKSRGDLVPCKLLGVLYLLDRGEKDDKLIAISSDSPLEQINDISDLSDYTGILEIIQLWFTNYKGSGKMKSLGYGDKTEAEHLLKKALEASNKAEL